MNEQERWRIFQIHPGKAMPVYIDPEDPKDLKTIQAILRKLKADETA